MTEIAENSEQNSHLQNQNSFELSRNEIIEDSKFLKFLNHLKQNRIFFFIVAAALLVFIAVMQIHIAYRSYEDNERLVKLWIQEKQLKDMMSQKHAELKQAQANKHADNPELNIQLLNAQDLEKKQIQKQVKPLEQSSQEEKDKANQSDNFAKMSKNPKKTSINYKPTSQHPTSRPPGTRISQNIRPVAGISRVQATTAAKWLAIKDESIDKVSALTQEQREYYEKKYGVSQYNELPFCIVIPSYNNVKNERHFKNMKSIIMQNYTNYHIVFIDDASTDGTGEEIQKFMANQTKIPQHRYKIIKNAKQMRAMPNIRRAAKQFCQPYEIFVIIDGDDELIGRQVLKLFNSVFQKEQVWFVYSNFLTIRGNVGYSRPFPDSIIRSNTYRKYPFVTSHLRAFYTQLFLNIKEEDLQDDEGNYLKAANDVAICLPILQQSHDKIFYVRELTYFYNSNTGQNNHQLRLRQQKANDRMLRKRKSYKALSSFYKLKDENKPNN